MKTIFVRAAHHAAPFLECFVCNNPNLHANWSKAAKVRAHNLERFMCFGRAQVVCA